MALFLPVQLAGSGGAEMRWTAGRRWTLADTWDVELSAVSLGRAAGRARLSTVPLVLFKLFSARLKAVPFPVVAVASRPPPSSTAIPALFVKESAICAV